MKATLTATEENDRAQFIYNNQEAFRFGAADGTGGEYEMMFRFERVMK